MSTARRAKAAQETPARRFLERGMARAALAHRFVRPAVDAQGHRLRAAELGEHTSAARLERLARGQTAWTGKPTQRHCLVCSRAGDPNPWHPVDTLCPRLVCRHG